MLDINTLIQMLSGTGQINSQLSEILNILGNNSRDNNQQLINNDSNIMPILAGMLQNNANNNMGGLLSTLLQNTNISDIMRLFTPNTNNNISDATNTVNTSNNTTPSNTSQPFNPELLMNILGQMMNNQSMRNQRTHNVNQILSDKMKE